MNQDEIKVEVELNDSDIKDTDAISNGGAVDGTPDLTDIEIKMDGETLRFDDKAVEDSTEDSDIPAEDADEAVDASQSTGLSNALETAKDLNDSFRAEGDKLAAVGLSLDDLHQEFIDGNGKISEKTLEKVKEAGYSEQLIKGYLRGVTAAANEVRRQFLDSLGGESAFTAMTEWASKNGDPQLVDAFNLAIERDDLQTAVAIGKSLQREQKSAHARKYGTKNKHVMGGDVSASATGPKGFSSEAAMIKAINDPRYNSDRAYTEAVKAKILAMGN
ncbi:capsid assembly protein [Chromobacterium haemolyticum]|uniref:capsid assembly protein n=1 Tax=Chromobacterium TaxID=535 RepID=UPI0040568121